MSVFPSLFGKWRVLLSKASPASRLALGSTWTRTLMTSKHHKEDGFISRYRQAKAILEWHGPAYCCDEYLEPLSRYRQGGCHPTHLGDTFKHGRYKILHKLGWDDEETVWLARDNMLARNVSIKIFTSNSQHVDPEVQILEHLSYGSASHPGKRYIKQLLDQFEHQGPNGTHRCAVFALYGESVPVATEWPRLPGRMAWEISRQITQALDYIHTNGVVHGSMHPDSISFPNTTSSYQSEEDLLKSLEEPRTGKVWSYDGHHLTAQIPRYLVNPTSPPFEKRDFESCQIELGYFHRVFFVGQQAQTCFYPYFKAPEEVFTSQHGQQADIWSLACSIFQLVTGEAPFGGILLEQEEIIPEWIMKLGELPREWRGGICSPQTFEDCKWQGTLHEWLHESYFCQEQESRFSKADIDTLGTLLLSMMQYRPLERPRASDLLNHAWFSTQPLLTVPQRALKTGRC